ncbi:MAG: hypothetical protein ACRD1T_05760, partial [Acidimicrobiia bacterium]
SVAHRFAEAMDSKPLEPRRIEATFPIVAPNTFSSGPRRAMARLFSWWDPGPSDRLVGIEL